jgi:hypothetical protein
LFGFLFLFFWFDRLSLEEEDFALPLISIICFNGEMARNQVYNPLEK